MATGLRERKLNSNQLYTAEKVTLCHILLMVEELSRNLKSINKGNEKKKSKNTSK